MIRFASIRFVLIAATLLAGGCADQERYYTLTPDAATEPPPDTKAEYSVVVGPAAVPEVVDRSQLVVRVSANQVSVPAESRKTEPLRTPIPRVVAANLATALPEARVLVYLRPAIDVDFRVVLDVQRFESAPGQGVIEEVHWMVRRSADPETRTGRSLVREAAPGADLESLAAAHSRALAAVSRDIADAINSLRKR